MRSRNNIYLALAATAMPMLTACNCSNRQPSHPIQKRPNIVWFLAEDISPHFLGLFNDGKGALTPNLSKLAAEGAIYTNAYSNAPVSSAARSTLITGCYAPKFAGSLHRKIEEMPMPENLRMFPTYFRKNGYYTCNASKTDYNVVLDEEAWDVVKGEMGGWRNRKDKDQPFFFQRNNGVTHESCLHFTEDTYHNTPTRYNPADTYIHPHLPNTPLMRYTYATLYDRIEEADRELGEMIQMLREDSLMENTFIFFFGDNGGCVPGTKGYTNDLGLHVPMVVYIPQSWRERLGIPAGSIQKDLVSFMDLPPTIMKLAGINIPEQMDGIPFMGEGIHPHKDKSIMGYGDRYDELYAFNRVIRKGAYRYERNYVPYHSRSLYAFYRYKQLAFQEWKQLYEAGSLNHAQSAFFEPMGTEALYDLQNDPNELHNLVNDSQYAKEVKALREEMNNYMIDKADIGFFPEPVIYEEAMENPHTFGQKNQKRIEQFIRVADLQLLPFAQAEQSLKEALTSGDPVIRWWGLTTCAYFGQQAATLASVAETLLRDDRSYIRSRAQVFLSKLGHHLNRDHAMSILNNSRTGTETLLVLNDFTYMIEAKLMQPFGLQESDIQSICKGVDWRINYLNKLSNN